MCSVLRMEPVHGASPPSGYSTLCFYWRSQSSQHGSLAGGSAMGSVTSRVTSVCNLLSLLVERFSRAKGGLGHFFLDGDFGSWGK